MEYFRKSLRNKNIDYRHGLFFVTSQISWNKSLLGAIVGEKVVLNELGREIERCWLDLPRKYPELELGEFVFMPNHFHAIVKINHRATNKTNHLGFLMGRFKGVTSYIYGKFKREGKVADIGEHLWQPDYWDDLISSDEELAAFIRYIRANPANWSRDRWGAVTSYMLGEVSLLNRPKVAFVASQGFYASDLKPRRLTPTMTSPKQLSKCGGAANSASQCGTSVPPQPLISTFTSAQERDALRRALAKKRPIIQVIPQGIPLEDELSPELQLALKERRALLISPQPTGSRLNKKVATWCNEYVLKQAAEIWVGDISPNGMLAMMLKGLRAD